MLFLMYLSWWGLQPHQHTLCLIQRELRKRTSKINILQTAGKSLSLGERQCALDMFIASCSPHVSGGHPTTQKASTVSELLHSCLVWGRTARLVRPGSDIFNSLVQETMGPEGMQSGIHPRGWLSCTFVMLSIGVHFPPSALAKDECRIK